MTIEEIQTKLDEAVIMLNKRQLKSGIALVQEVRHSLDKLIASNPTDDSWSRATNDHAEAMITGKPCLCPKCFR